LIRVYRLYRKRRRDAAFTGEGARLEGARWNLPGTPAIYAASTLGLALLEFLVHLDPSEMDIARLELETCSADIPSGVAFYEVPAKALPRQWKAVPWSASSQAFGTRLLQEGQYAAIAVPSVVVPTECNYLLNPLHPDFHKIKLGSPQPFLIDRRLF
jgi:RES domain-containing protein